MGKYEIRLRRGMTDETTHVDRTKAEQNYTDTRDEMGGHLHLHISYLQFEELGRHIALRARSTFTLTVAFSLDLHLTIHYLVSLGVHRRIDSIHGWHGA